MIIREGRARSSRKDDPTRMARNDEQTAVLLIAHGSRHAPANDDLFQLADRFRTRGPYTIVEPSFLELAAPDIAEGGDRAVARGARRVLMIPYFLSAGVHLLRDLTAAREDLQARHPQIEFRLGAPLGPHVLLDELVAERIQQAEEGRGFPEFASSSEMAKVYTPMDHERES